MRYRLLDYVHGFGGSVITCIEESYTVYHPTLLTDYVRSARGVSDLRSTRANDTFRLLPEENMAL